jgi:HAMP domain-containing protein
VPLKKFIISTQVLDRLGPPRAFFRRLSVTSKMLLGYAILVILTLLVAGYALVSLRRINSLNEQIVKADVVIQESSDLMLDSLLAMDSYEKRFLVLGTNDMVGLFQKRWREFVGLLDVRRQGFLAKTAKRSARSKISGSTTTRYSRTRCNLSASGKPKGARIISNGQIKNVVDKLIQALRTHSADAKAAEDGRMKQLVNVGRTAFLTSIALCVCSILIGAVAAVLITHYISSSVSRLIAATTHFAGGDFSYDPQIVSGDEIGLLSQAFATMGRRLARLEETYFDASPLTRLPGGVAIEKALEKRIHSELPLAFCWIDLSNFKAFNDRWGYAARAQADALASARSSPSTATASERAMMTKSGSVLAFAAAEMRASISVELTSSLPGRCPQRLSLIWSSMWIAATPTRIISRTVRAITSSEPNPANGGNTSNVSGRNRSSRNRYPFAP